MGESTKPPTLIIPYGSDLLPEPSKWLSYPVQISAIQGNIESAGPALRTEIFFHGCTMGCPGCINEWTKYTPHHDTTVAEVVKEVQRLQNTNITIGGGEPFEQQGALYSLLRALHNLYLGRLVEFPFSVFLYTGYEFEMVRDSACLHGVDWVCTGPFQRDNKFVKLHNSFVGSSNQEVRRLFGAPFSPYRTLRYSMMELDQYGRFKEDIT